MELEGAIIKEQGITFAIVIVKPYVFNNSSEKEKAQITFSRYFPGMPTILMSQDSRGTPTYYGRTDISKFLANTDINRIPWQHYTFND